MDLTNVKRDDWILAGVALLLAIDLLFFPWFSASASVGAFSISVSVTGTGSPDGWLGVLAMLCALAVVVDLVLERLAPQLTVPAISSSRTTTRFVLAVAAAALMALKFILHIHFSLFAWGFYLGVVLAAALVYLAWQARSGLPFAMPERFQRVGGHSIATAGPDPSGSAAPPPAPNEPPAS